MADSRRLQVRVQPGARRTVVGGEHDGHLVVRVTARAVDGAANRAVLAAVAEALGVRPRQVRLMRGATSRVKLLEVVAAPADLDDRVAQLRRSG